MLLGQDIAPTAARSASPGASGSDSATTSSATAALRVGHGRVCDRARDHRRARRVRDRVLRLRRRRDGSDLQPRRQAALLHRRQAAGAARHPDARRVAHRDGPPALAEPRIVVHAHPGDQGRDPLERVRRLRAPADGAPRRQPGALRRERPPLRAARGGRSRRRPDSVRLGLGRPRGQRRDRRRAVEHGRRILAAAERSPSAGSRSR